MPTRITNPEIDAVLDSCDGWRVATTVRNKQTPRNIPAGEQS